VFVVLGAAVDSSEEIHGGGTGVHALLFYLISRYALAETCTQNHGV